MHGWRDINGDAWTFTRRWIVGSGGGIGPFSTAYAIWEEMPLALNGRFSAKIRFVDKAKAGAGLVWRADDSWTFMAFYVAPESEDDTLATARIGFFKQGAFVQLASLPDIALDDDYNLFAVEYRSAQVRAEIQAGDRKYQISRTCAERPFPGRVGLVKFYGSEVAVKDPVFEASSMAFPATHNRSVTKFDYDVFICHSGKDAAKAAELAEVFKRQGVRYWLDREQITYGDPVTRKIEEGLTASRYVLPLLSKNLGTSGWTRAEYGAILNGELSGPSERVVIPLKIDDGPDADIPILLRDKKRVSYLNETEFGEFVRFLLLR
jgi:hypothetical protein